jgi:putative transposase
MPCSVKDLVKSLMIPSLLNTNVEAKHRQNFHPARSKIQLLHVSTSGYYEWNNRLLSFRAKNNIKLSMDIKRIFDDEKARVGAKRITKGLRAEGSLVVRHRVARLMRAQGWHAKAVRKFKATTNSNHQLAVAPNLLQQNFSADKPDKKYVSDITYIWTGEGWLYLAVVMDLYSRMIVGWSMSGRMTAKLVCDALQMALWRRKLPRDVIVHSDRGSQYCSFEYQKLLANNGMICSMSKRGDCYDNAAMESWNHSLKVEAIHGEKLLARDQAKNHMFDYIDVYYNRKRLHSSLNYLSPENFEAQLVA